VNVGASVGWGFAVGGSLVLGAAIAARFRLQGRATAVVTAFGGGLLLAAVALELVPDADQRAGLWPTAAGLLAGMLVYVAADVALTRREDMRTIRRAVHAAAAGRPMPIEAKNAAEVARGESIAAGLLLDGVPESLALGLTIAEGAMSKTLLVGILAGNVVEAYGAAQPILAGGRSKRFAVGLLALIGVTLVGSTVFGATVLADWSDSVVGTTEAVAAGAVLAVITIAVVPHVFAEVSRWVAVASVSGFVVGYLL
jgi:ZIP family zinc transporter